MNKICKNCGKILTRGYIRKAYSFDYECLPTCEVNMEEEKNVKRFIIWEKDYYRITCIRTYQGGSIPYYSYHFEERKIDSLEKPAWIKVEQGYTLETLFEDLRKKKEQELGV